MNDEFYTAKVKLVSAGAGGLRAIGRIVRNDTLESVAGAIEFGTDEEEVSARCMARLAQRFALLARPPWEWRRMELRRAVLAYQEFRCELTRHSIELQKLRAAGGLSEEVLHEKMRALVDCVGAETLALSRMVRRLSVEDQGALRDTPLEVAGDAYGPADEDEIDARLALYEEFSERS